MSDKPDKFDAELQKLNDALIDLVDAFLGDVQERLKEVKRKAKES